MYVERSRAAELRVTPDTASIFSPATLPHQEIVADTEPP